MVKPTLKPRCNPMPYILGLYEVVSYLTEKYENILLSPALRRWWPQWPRYDALLPSGLGKWQYGCHCQTSIQYGSSYLYPTISMGVTFSGSKSQDGTDVPPETRSCSRDGNLGYELDLTSLPQELDRSRSSRSLQNDSTTCSIRKTLPLDQSGQGSNQAAVQFTYQDRTVVTCYVRVLSTVEEIESRPWNSKGWKKMHSIA